MDIQMDDDINFPIIKLMQELRSMPEYQLYIELETFGLSIYVFEKNYQDLMNLIVFLSNDERADRLEWLRNRDQLSILSQFGSLS